MLKKPYKMQSKLLTHVQDFEDAAREKLYGPINYYYSRGVSGYDQTRKDSRKAFQRFRFRPRVLNSTLVTSLSTTVLGHDIKMPICISPTALHGLAHPSKERGAIKAAQSQGTAMILSSVSNTHVTTLHQEAADGLLWMQMYFFKNSAITKSIIRNAEKAGFKALVVTIDSSGLQVNSTKKTSSLGKLDYIRSRKGLSCVNLLLEEHKEEYINSPDPHFLDYTITQVAQSHATEEDILWLKSFTKLPIVLKGVLSAKTARKAASLGVNGILVSAHGGRQLEGVPAPIDALQEVVDAVKDSGVEVYMDGGVRNGTDVLKALALGARAVFVGRPVLWGLAVNGADGIEQVLQILRDELKLSMILSGVGDVRSVPSSLVLPESKYLAAKL
ncbi:putative hydroxyacid oxidase 1 [Apostichopus japonicus]|uniref:(S)-2-hydroxy-acid oxidase n=1 Tax=Stichopus japonicus TaxID=307972 RepID=A0A2G8KK50_STIJA|nr:putative hydroxyacid oxidase 1 [Apostichopus japonicus]